MSVNRPDNFDWGALRSFLAVARSGKLTEAAQNLSLDHSTLSRRIQSLEESLDAQLFDRGMRGYILTSHGQNLLRLAEQMESIALNIAAGVGRSRLDIAGTVRVGTTDDFGTAFLAQRLPKLRDSHPDLDIHLITLTKSISLSKREADISIGLSQPTEGRLYSRKLTDFNWGLFASREYLNSHTKITNRTSLRGHCLISYVHELVYTPEIEVILSALNDLKITFRSSNLIAQFEAAKTGNGLCLLPDYLASRESTLCRVLPNDFSVVGSYWMSVHSDIRELARVRIVGEFIAQQVQCARNQFGSSQSLKASESAAGALRHNPGFRPASVVACSNGF